MFYVFSGDFQPPRIGLCCFPLEFSLFYLCSTCVLLVFTCVHLCSLVFTCVHLCPFVFHLCSTCVHLCSTCVLLVFICVHLCSFVFLLVWCLRLDRKYIVKQEIIVAFMLVVCSHQPCPTNGRFYIESEF